ncbi:MAG: GGDEF domain-containing protein, partial [Methylobacter sp.]|nr:GGDEF domain-containing protein [Methylobacter sp.]
MSFDLTVQQIFSWTTQLSAQQDYQELTHKFLGILAEIPWINCATAYEIYNHERKIPGETETVRELLIRQFPLDFTRNDEQDHNSLFDGLDHSADLHLSISDGSGFYVWAIYSIKGGDGPERAIHIEGTFDQKM